MKTEIKEWNGRQFKYTSHPTKRIHKVGTDEVYDEAYDTMVSDFQYEVTDEDREVSDGE